MKVQFFCLLLSCFEWTQQSANSFDIPSPNSISSNSQSNLLIFGLGRVGLEVAKEATDINLVSQAIGTVRKQSQEDFENIPINTRIVRVHIDSHQLETIASECRYLLISIPPQYGELNENLIAKFKNIVHKLHPGCWIGLISTTGVYGNHDGEWVTEDSECRCVDGNSTAIQFLNYESTWATMAASAGHMLRIFRCAGIYSNDQSALHTVYKKGLEISATKKTNEVSYTNRIHVHDIARAVVASMNQHDATSLLSEMKLEDSLSTKAFRVYNLADNLPETRSTVLSYASDLFDGAGISINKNIESKQDITTRNVSNRGSRRQTDRKLISNKRMLTELFPDTGLTFPTYKEGLNSILDCKDNPWWS